MTKNVLITGCQGQIGQSFSKSLKSSGYYVIGVDLHDDDMNACVDLYHKVDITKSGEVECLLDLLSIDIDVLINNAGVSVFTPFEVRTEDEIAYVLDVNVKGVILMTQVVFNHSFKLRKKGCIVNIASIYGLCSGDMRLYQQGDRRTPEIYGASKAAVINLTKYFAAYMAPYNVRVNCISPGGVFNNQSKDFISKYSNRVPMGRMANVNELDNTLQYLLDDRSSYLTGQNIIIDGGFTAW